MPIYMGTHTGFMTCHYIAGLYEQQVAAKLAAASSTLAAFLGPSPNQDGRSGDAASAEESGAGAGPSSAAAFAVGGKAKSPAKGGRKASPKKSPAKAAAAKARSPPKPPAAADADAQTSAGEGRLAGQAAPSALARPLARPPKASAEVPVFGSAPPPSSPWAVRLGRKRTSLPRPSS